MIGFDTHLLQVSRVREEKQQCWESCAVCYRHSPTYVVSSYEFSGLRNYRKKCKKTEVTTFWKHAPNVSFWE